MSTERCPALARFVFLFDTTLSRAPPVDVISGPHGVWEPFLLAAGGHVLVLYALELKNGGEQVLRTASV